MEFVLDARINSRVFWVMVELLEKNIIQSSQIKKQLYLEEYNRYKGV